MNALSPSPSTTPSPPSHADTACPSQPFWAGLAEGRLLLQHDAESGRALFYPRAVTADSGAPLAWREASGRGTVIAVTVSRVPMPGFDPAPCTFALVRLEEGPCVFTPLLGCKVGEARIGMKARVLIAPQGRPEPFCFEVDHGGAPA